jgi:hypothetical protein
MVHELRPGPEAPFAFIEACSHLLNLRENSLPHLFVRHPARNCNLRRLDSLRKIPEPGDHQSSQAMLQRRDRCQRLAPVQALSNALVRTLVGQKEVLQNLRGVPFARGSLAHGFVGRRSDRCFKFCRQAFEIGFQDNSILIAGRLRSSSSRKTMVRRRETNARGAEGTPRWRRIDQAGSGPAIAKTISNVGTICCPNDIRVKLRCLANPRPRSWPSISLPPWNKPNTVDHRLHRSVT